MHWICLLVLTGLLAVYNRGNSDASNTNADAMDAASASYFHDWSWAVRQSWSQVSDNLRASLVGWYKIPTIFFSKVLGSATKHESWTAVSSACWTGSHRCRPKQIPELQGDVWHGQRVPKIDIADFNQEIFSLNFSHVRPVVVTGVVHHWPARIWWTWDELTNPKGRYSAYHKSFAAGLSFYFSPSGKNDSLFLDNLILEQPFSVDCPYASLSGQDNNSVGLFGSNFLPRLNQGWAVAKADAVRAGLLEPGADFPEAIQGYVVAGPAGSGSRLHADPESTAYWNALVHGRKHWMFLSAKDFDALVASVASRGAGFVRQVSQLTDLQEQDLEFAQKDQVRLVRELLLNIAAYRWFESLLPLLKEASINFQCHEVIAEAGDIVYGPPGMFHVVLALEDSIGCSEQLVDETNLVQFLQDETNRYDPAFAHLGCQAARKHWPHLLASIADFCIKGEQDLTRQAARRRPSSQARGSDVADESRTSSVRDNLHRVEL
eukprot:TRINITY_DN72266_c0_g1_i1.p1 TRINITY_DN72266_c0_g1~~TRINITY_DN72266_c0_g1_i1.p1  ORF type:complete len:491 (-),score=85.39 TRINITY_DN72266_c0_g1_i1:276-1748(-)